MTTRTPLLALLAAVIALSVAGPSSGAGATHSAQLHMWRCIKQGFPDANPRASFCFSLILADGDSQLAGNGWVGPDKALKRAGCLAAHWKGSIVPPPYGVLVGGGWWCRSAAGQSGQLRFTVHKGTPDEPLVPGAYLGLGRITFKSPTRVDPAALKSAITGEQPLARLTFSLYLSL